MPTSIQDIDRGMDAVIREIQSAGGYVDIGIQSDEYENLLQIAIDNEFGTHRIPARPYIRSAIDRNEDKILSRAEKLSKLIIKGTLTKYDALVEMGLMIESEIKQRIINLRTPPNAPYTIAKKGSDNPLIDTGNLLGSIRYAVKSGESE